MQTPATYSDFLSSAVAEAANERRSHPRQAVILPIDLVTKSGEKIPAVIVNLSASGLLALVEARFSSILHAADGTHLSGQVFFDTQELCGLELEVARIESRGEQLLGLGCKFVLTPGQAPLTNRPTDDPSSVA